MSVKKMYYELEWISIGITVTIMEVRQKTMTYVQKLIEAKRLFQNQKPEL